MCILCTRYLHAHVSIDPIPFLMSPSSGLSARLVNHFSAGLAASNPGVPAAEDVSRSNKSPALEGHVESEHTGRLNVTGGGSIGGGGGGGEGSGEGIVLSVDRPDAEIRTVPQPSILVAEL